MAFAGPLYILINAVCRHFPPEILKLLQSVSESEDRNTLVTLIFCTTSAIKKIGRFTEAPRNGKVYRGIGRMLLPPSFWVPHGDPAWRGGVERAIMSTTTDKDVALLYAGGKGTVAEISVGRTDMGGILDVFSQVESPSLLCAPIGLPVSSVVDRGDRRRLGSFTPYHNGCDCVKCIKPECKHVLRKHCATSFSPA